MQMRSLFSHGGAIKIILSVKQSAKQNLITKTSPENMAVWNQAPDVTGPSMWGWEEVKKEFSFRDAIASKNLKKLVMLCE